MKAKPRSATLSVLVLAVVMLAGCHGGGSGSSPADASAAPLSSVSGTVYAPSSTLAALRRSGWLERLARLAIPQAHALLDGVVKVDDGTRVELVRINSLGVSTDVLATGTTRGGQFSFDLSSFALLPTSDLVVQAVTPTNNVALRAVITGATVDISLESEATLRLIVERLAAAPSSSLKDLSQAEVRQLRDAVEFAAFDASVRVSGAIDVIANAMVAAARTAGLTGLVDAALRPGEAELAPGDIGEYFPLDVGMRWTYGVTRDRDPLDPVSSTDVVQVIGTKELNGARVFEVSNGIEGSRDFYEKTPRGIVRHHPDGRREFFLRFPLVVGDKYVAYDRANVDFGLDLDGDGKNETADEREVVTVTGYTTFRDPRNGALVPAIQISRQRSGSVRRSSDGAIIQSEAVNSSRFATYAQGQGLVGESWRGGIALSATVRVISFVRSPP